MFIWGLSKFYNRNLSPDFNRDPANCILHRFHLHKSQESAHAVLQQFCQRVLAEKKKQTFANGCLTLYSLAAAGYFEQDFYEGVFANFIGEEEFQKLSLIIGLQAATGAKEGSVGGQLAASPYSQVSELANIGNTPHLDQLSLLSQACAILRRPEYNPMLIQWLANALEDQTFNLFQVRQNDSEWNISNEHSFISCIQAVTFLMGDDPQQVTQFQETCLPKLQPIYDNIEVELSHEHATLIPSLLWSFICLQDKGVILNNRKLIKRSLEIV